MPHLPSFCGSVSSACRPCPLRLSSVDHRGDPMEMRGRLKALCFPNNRKQWFLPPTQVSHGRSRIFFFHKALCRRLTVKESSFSWKSFAVLAPRPKLVLFLCQGLVMRPRCWSFWVDVLGTHRALFQTWFQIMSYIRKFSWIPVFSFLLFLLAWFHLLCSC